MSQRSGGNRRRSGGPSGRHSRGSHGQGDNDASGRRISYEADEQKIETAKAAWGLSSKSTSSSTQQSSRGGGGGGGGSNAPRHPSSGRRTPPPRSRDPRDNRDRGGRGDARGSGAGGRSPALSDKEIFLSTSPSSSGGRYNGTDPRGRGNVARNGNHQGGRGERDRRGGGGGGNAPPSSQHQGAGGAGSRRVIDESQPPSGSSGSKSQARGGSAGGGRRSVSEQQAGGGVRGSRADSGGNGGSGGGGGRRGPSPHQQVPSGGYPRRMSGGPAPPQPPHQQQSPVMRPPQPPGSGGGQTRPRQLSTGSQGSAGHLSPVMPNLPPPHPIPSMPQGMPPPPVLTPPAQQRQASPNRRASDASNGSGPTGSLAQAAAASLVRNQQQQQSGLFASLQPPRPPDNRGGNYGQAVGRAGPTHAASGGAGVGGVDSGVGRQPPVPPTGSGRRSPAIPPGQQQPGSAGFGMAPPRPPADMVPIQKAQGTTSASSLDSATPSHPTPMTPPRPPADGSFAPVQQQVAPPRPPLSGASAGGASSGSQGTPPLRPPSVVDAPQTTLVNAPVLAEPIPDEPINVSEEDISVVVKPKVVTTSSSSLPAGGLGGSGSSLDSGKAGASAGIGGKYVPPGARAAASDSPVTATGSSSSTAALVGTETTAPGSDGKAASGGSGTASPATDPSAPSAAGRSLESLLSTTASTRASTGSVPAASQGPMKPLPQGTGAGLTLAGKRASTGNMNKNRSALEETEEARTERIAQAKQDDKHPLDCQWTLLYDKRQAATGRARGEQGKYESNLTTLGAIETVEEFWSLVNNVKPPSQVEINANLHLFKTGIKPMWEDPANAQGGKWVITLKAERQHLDDYWQRTILALVGGEIDSPDITGVVMSRRKGGDRIALWNRDKRDRVSVREHGRKLRDLLGVGPAVRMEYLHHTDSLRTGTSYSSEVHFQL